jgi:hypothetical protein
MGNPSGAQDFIAFAINSLRALLVVAYLMSSLRNAAGHGKQSVWHGRTRWVHQRHAKAGQKEGKTRLEKGIAGD